MTWRGAQQGLAPHQTLPRARGVMRLPPPPCSHDPVSTGPNILAWVEWEHWLIHKNVRDAVEVESDACGRTRIDRRASVLARRTRSAAQVDRLRRVFPVLLAYHRWCRKHRTWPDGAEERPCCTNRFTAIGDSKPAVRIEIHRVSPRPPRPSR